jgi:hypothetical protein
LRSNLQLVISVGHIWELEGTILPHVDDLEAGCIAVPPQESIAAIHEVAVALRGHSSRNNVKVLRRNRHLRDLLHIAPLYVVNSCFVSFECSSRKQAKSSTKLERRYSLVGSKKAIESKPFGAQLHPDKIFPGRDAGDPVVSLIVRYCILGAAHHRAARPKRERDFACLNAENIDEQARSRHAVAVLYGSEKRRSSA